jgi:asparagine synthetase B (glutamine-hydrolysing)
MGKIMFDTFSDTDTINSYLETLGERIFKSRDGQFRVAYLAKSDSKQIIEAVLG